MPDIEKEIGVDRGRFSLKFAAKFKPLIQVAVTLVSLSLTFSLGALVEKNYQVTRNVPALPFFPQGIRIPEFPTSPITSYPPVILQAAEVVEAPPPEVQPIQVVVWREGEVTKLGLYIDGALTQETTVDVPEELPELPETPPTPELKLPEISIVIGDEESRTGWGRDPRRPGSTHDGHR